MLTKIFNFEKSAASQVFGNTSIVVAIACVEQLRQVLVNQ